MPCIEIGQIMFSVHQHWDPLKVCAVGRSYPPEFYDYIKNDNVRRVFYRIAEETEQDYQTLISTLKSFGVEVVRPSINNDREFYFNGTGYQPPPMTPRDHVAMMGDVLYMPTTKIENAWKVYAGSDWPAAPKNNYEFNQLPKNIKSELENIKSIFDFGIYPSFDTLEARVKESGNSIVYDTQVNTAMCSRIGKDLYFGTDDYRDDINLLYNKYSTMFPDHRCHIINTGGHNDGTYCPVKPGLIVSLRDVPTYADTFPDWEVVYLPGQSWSKIQPFLKLKQKNNGKWWVPGEELNDDFTAYVEIWMKRWVGYVEETVFDVNMLVIDEKNVICNNYNQQVFDAFDRHGITGHIVNFRHRYFWDGGLHCVTSDLHREGTQKDYFPERG